ncbi:hypothetical protein IEO21_04324 [Rhodonia placenta]|uniref:Uncharacterized protein n=1 Tax=Rhodonia placenta TaxID=104341 RepID=A0A8H7P406_9APHY|nr:hypothetical protein IEO21_04324 [Postia placenta]
MSRLAFAVIRPRGGPLGLHGTAPLSLWSRDIACSRARPPLRSDSWRAGRAIRSLNTRSFQTEVVSERVGIDPALVVPRPNAAPKPEPSAQVVSRPFGITERYFLDIRGPHGYSDPFITISIDTSSGTARISNEQVVLTWAAIRLRHTLLASRVQSTPQGPSFVYLPPLTKAHALRQARMNIDFEEDSDRATWLGALHNRWWGNALDDVLDIRSEIYKLAWLEEAGHEPGGERRYAFGIQTTHFAVDGLGMCDVAGQFTELLADPGRAEAELDEYFANPKPRLPDAYENLLPEPDAAFPEEKQKALEAYKALMASGNDPSVTGILPDGNSKDENVEPNIIRYAWSEEQSRAIVAACKKHHVTVTQLACAALVVAAAEARPGRDIQNPIFKHHLPIDLWPRARSDPRGIAVRMAHYPMFIRAPSLAGLNTKEGLHAAILEVAKQCKDGHAGVVNSPYFWHIIRHYLLDCQRMIDSLAADAPILDKIPFFPLFSSMGDLNKLVPGTLRAIPPPETTVGAAFHPDSRSEGEIRVPDVTVNLKVAPALAIVHVWTFNKKMTIQFKHNKAWATPEVVDPYLERIVEILTSFSES